MPMHISRHDVLIIVDAQNDFCTGGALAVPQGEVIVPVANRIAQRFAHVLATHDWHPPGHLSFASSHEGRKPFEQIEVFYGGQTLWPDHCVQGTRGAEFHGDLDLRRVELVVRKGFRPEIDSYSAFYENDRRTPTGLAGYLREREFRRVFLAGLATDYCVHYSVLDARREGFDVVVIEDACRAIDLDGSLARAFSQMNEAGVRRVWSEEFDPD
jgi:nicotinamidase/pyrazinamidase